jgi:hypothetical protein
VTEAGQLGYLTAILLFQIREQVREQRGSRHSVYFDFRDGPNIIARVFEQELREMENVYEEYLPAKVYNSPVCYALQTPTLRVRIETPCSHPSEKKIESAATPLLTNLSIPVLAYPQQNRNSLQASRTKMDVDMKNKDDNEEKGIIVPVSSSRDRDRDRDRERDRDFDRDKDRDRDHDRERRDRDKDRDHRREPGAGFPSLSCAETQTSEYIFLLKGRSKRGGGDHWEPESRRNGTEVSRCDIYFVLADLFLSVAGARAPGVVPAPGAVRLPHAVLVAVPGHVRAPVRVHDLDLGAVTASMWTLLPALWEVP